MHRLPVLLATTILLTAAGCVTSKPTTATSLEPPIKAKVEKGIIEPGFTPEMVYLALGKPSEPAQSLADATANGTWVYHDFQGKEGDIVKPGFRRKVSLDAAKKVDVITTERIDPQALAKLPANSLHVTFRDGRVVEIQRVAGI
jgi:hypothetical protein